MRKSSSKLPLLVAAALALACAGCYEGWDYDRNGGDGNNPPTPKPPTPAIPPYFYILFEPIVLGASAIADDGCFAEPGLAAYRSAEWSLRVQTIAAALTPLAVTFKMVPHEIAKDDCKKLAAVRGAAVASKPWAPDPDPADDPLDRSLIDVRAVFWEGDVELDPPAVVTSAQWVAFAAMAKAGRRARTVNHFVLEHQAEGYFHDWAALNDPSASVNGTPINDVDPTDAGVKARAAAVQADAVALATWLTEHP